jgi:hypothetical protein
MAKKKFDLFEKARVKKPGLVRRFLLTSDLKELIGRTGTVALIEQGEHSKETLYSLIFDDGEVATGAFFANELERLSA